MSKFIKYILSTEWLFYGFYHFRYFIFNRYFYTFLFKIKAFLLNVKIGNDLKIYNKVSIIKFPSSKIIFGDKVNIVANEKRATATTGSNIFRIKTFSPKCEVVIGNGTGFGGGGSLSCRTTFIKIGKNCNIGPNIQILDSNVHCLNKYLRNESCPEDDKGIIISDNVFIGMNVTILKGVKIGENSVVGASSVVVSDVKSNSIYAGNPAKFIRNI